MKSIRDLALSGRRLFLRVDFNVPLDGGRVEDDTRIVETLPTVRLALEQGARVICASHLGKAKGKREARAVARSRWPCGSPSGSAGRCGSSTTASDPRRSARWALSRTEKSSCSRTSASMPAKRPTTRHSRRPSRLSPTSTWTTLSAPRTGRTPRSSACRSSSPRRARGLLLEKEVRELSRLLEPERPFAAILGGAKISGKIDTLRVLSRRADLLLVGGGMANHFVRAIGLPVGKSLLEEDKVPLAREILDFCKEAGKMIALPSDFVVAKSPDDGAGAKTVGIDKIPADAMALDVGPRTLEQFERLLGPARTIFWNGPMGVFEKPPFDKGTRALAELVAGSKAVTVVGGGESVQAAKEAGVADKFTHVSTGGGASLEFLAEGKLPGVEALEA